jgi:hypothetical protein
MLILFHAAISGLLRLAQARLFAARLDAFCLLAGAPACLLGARSAAFAGYIIGIARASLERTTLAQGSTQLFYVGGLDACTARFSRSWGPRLLAILGDRNSLFS